MRYPLRRVQLSSLVILGNSWTNDLKVENVKAALSWLWCDGGKPGETLVGLRMSPPNVTEESLKVKGKLTTHSHKDFTVISLKPLTSKKHILISKMYRKPP